MEQARRTCTKGKALLMIVILPPLPHITVSFQHRRGVQGSVMTTRQGLAASTPARTNSHPNTRAARQSKAPETSGSGAITPKDIHRVIKGTRGEKEKLDSSKFTKPLFIEFTN